MKFRILQLILSFCDDGAQETTNLPSKETEFTRPVKSKGILVNIGNFV